MDQMPTQRKVRQLTRARELFTSKQLDEPFTVCLKPDGSLLAQGV